MGTWRRSTAGAAGQEGMVAMTKAEQAMALMEGHSEAFADGVGRVVGIGALQALIDGVMDRYGMGEVAFSRSDGRPRIDGVRLRDGSSLVITEVPGDVRSWDVRVG